MTFKKIWRWVKIGYYIFFVVAVTILVGYLGFLMFGTLTDKNAVTNTALINVITLGLGLASLPGIFVQLISMMTLNDKKEFTVSTKCHNCKHLIELKMTEK